MSFHGFAQTAILFDDLEKSHGSIMVDARDGREYLDFYTYFASLPVGHNHPKVRDPEFQKKLLNAATANPAKGRERLTTPRALADWLELWGLAPPGLELDEDDLEDIRSRIDDAELDRPLQVRGGPAAADHLAHLAGGAQGG